MRPVSYDCAIRDVRPVTVWTEGSGERAWRLETGRLPTADGVRQPEDSTAAPVPFGEPDVMGAVDLDEAVPDRNERDRPKLAVKQARPAERETRPGHGVLEQEVPHPSNGG